MNNSTIRPRKVVRKEAIENWDDDDLDVGGDDFMVRSSSLNTNTATATSNPRDSMSSRLSIRSDIESNNGDEERQVHLPGDDERSTIDAIATAKRAGIPLPTNIPVSALLGGTIKRLGGKKVKKTIQDDWDDGDLEFPGEGELKIKNHDKTTFPDSLRQIGEQNSLSSPIRLLQPAPHLCGNSQSELKPNKVLDLLLENYIDDEYDDTCDEGTIKIIKQRQIPKLKPVALQPCNLQNTEVEEFERDFQLPLNNEPLRLSIRRDTPRTPSSTHDEFDEWGEGGSLGVRHGGKRDRISNRSSSVTAPSPSVSSSLTLESEDEGLDGLLLPSGPIHFSEILKKKLHDQSLNETSGDKSSISESKDDFLSGLEIGLGEVFDSNKLKINRNVKVKTTRQKSPVRPKAAVSLTFTSKPSNSITSSRLPRPLGSYERQSSSLEPVSESGGPIMMRHRRSHSRLGGHSSHMSITSISNLNTSACDSAPPSTPRQQEFLPKPSFTNIIKEPTTTSAQLLKLKRSMPSIRSFQSNNKLINNSRSERPISYIDNCKPNFIPQPRSPVERGRVTESNQNIGKFHHTPFLPAGATNSQSHHVLAKNCRNFRRHDSESSSNSLERHPSTRTVSRSTMRSRSPRRKGAEVLVREAATKRLLTKPVRRKHFGDGCELDAFDDLPTSRESEQRFIKEPVARGPPKAYNHRKKTDSEIRASSINMTNVISSGSREDLPRFARDTTASRMARENTLAQRIQLAHGAPLAALTNQWKAKLAVSSNLNLNKTRTSKSKKKKSVPQKPQLIKPLGNSNNAKSIKGMYYNPHTYRWEGNDMDLSTFDLPSSPSTGSGPSLVYKESYQSYREKDTLTPRPALIQQVKSTHNVQVVGGMVFDPQRMCWLKMPANYNKDVSTWDDAANSLESLNDEEEDVFKDVPDLEDVRTGDSSHGGLNSDGLREDFIVGEEFDVGPEFVRRQREEEQRWRRKVEMWIQSDVGIDRGSSDWRWIIRDMVMNREI